MTGFLAQIGAVLGRKFAESIDYQPIVREAMAKEFDRLASIPEYLHIADTLRRMADDIRVKSGSE